MLAALRGFESKVTFAVEVIDIDMDEALTAEYDELVPVLYGSRNGGTKLRICHYFLDVVKLAEFLNAR